MMNEAQISVSGYVATQPMWRETSNGRPNLSMRVAWTPRKMDRATGEWVDGNTSYVTVFCWRKLADHVAVCLRKGDPVLVQGRLSVRSYQDKQGVPRTAVDVDAQWVGHDLNRGVAQFTRTRPATGKTAAEHAAGLASAGGADSQQPGEGDDPGAITMPGGPGQAGPAGEAGLADDPAGHEMFDQDAIAALTEDSEDTRVPF